MQLILPKLGTNIFCNYYMCMECIGNVLIFPCKRQLQSFHPFLPRCLVYGSNFPIWLCIEGRATPPFGLKMYFLGMVYSKKQMSLVSSTYPVTEKKALILFHATKREGNLGYIHGMLNANKSSAIGKNMIPTCL